MKSITTLIVMVCALCATVTAARADVPAIIHFQGVLTDESGIPLADENVRLQFRLFDAPEGGELVWSQTFENVPVANGFYDVTLGGSGGLQAPPLSQVPFDEPYFMEIGLGEPGGSLESLGPRKPLGSVAYSLGSGAGSTDLLGSDTITLQETEDGTLIQVTDQSIDDSKLAPGAVATEKIQDGAVTTDKLANAAVDPSKIAGDASSEDRQLISREGVVSWEVASGGGEVVEAGPEGGLEVSREGGSNVVEIAIQDLGVTEQKLGDQSVTADKITDGAVGNDELADGSITAEKIAENEVVQEIAFTPDGGSEVVIRDRLVIEGSTNVQLTNPSPNTIRILASDVGGGGGGVDRIEPGAGLIGNGLDTTEPVIEVGQGVGVLVGDDDVSVDVPGLAGDGLTGSGDDFDVSAGDGIGVSGDRVVARIGSGLAFNSGGEIHVPLGGITSGELANNTVEGTDIRDLTITSADIANSTITEEKLAFSLGAGDITGVTAGEGLEGGGLEGDVDLSIAPSGVNSSHIEDLAITGADIAGATITEDKLAFTAGIGDITGVTTSDGLEGGGLEGEVDIYIAEGGVNSSHIEDLAITGADIADATISAGKLDFTPGTGDITGVAAGVGLTGGGDLGDVSLAIAPDGVTSTQIANLGIQNEDIADGVITASKLSFSPGDITGVSAGNGLAGGGAAGDVELSIPPGAIGSIELDEQVVFGGGETPGSVIVENSAGTSVGVFRANPTGSGGSVEIFNDSGIPVGHFMTNPFNDDGLFVLRSAEGDTTALILTSSGGGGVFAARNTNNESVLECTTHDGAAHGNINVYNTDNGRVDIAGIQGSDGTVYGTEFEIRSSDPLVPGRVIRHSGLAGGESAIYHRGKAMLVGGEVAVTLPDHFRTMASPGSVTVHLTPRSRSSKGLAALDATIDGFTAVELMDGTGSYEFDYVVYGVRRGKESFRNYMTTDEIARIDR